MTVLSRRRVRVTVARNETGEGRSWHGGIEGGLRIAFRGRKTRSREPNPLTVRLWNLSPESRAFLDEDDLRLALETGYGGAAVEPTLLFVGDVVDVEHAREGADRVTTIEVGDGERAFNDSYVSLSFTGGARVDEVVRRIAEAFAEYDIELDAQTLLALPSLAFEQGWSFEGRTRDGLLEVAELLSVDAFLMDGQLQIVDEGQAAGVLATVLSADTGLIGSPVRQKKRRGSGVEDLGWEVRALLQPQLRPAAYVRVESEAWTAFARVGDCEYSGDTHGRDWHVVADLTEMEAP